LAEAYLLLLLGQVKIREFDISLFVGEFFIDWPLFLPAFWIGFHLTVGMRILSDMETDSEYP